MATTMDFLVAADSGTHVYRAKGLEKPVLLRSLPVAVPAGTQTIRCNAAAGLVAVLLRTGSVGVWDIANSPSPQESLAEFEQPGPQGRRGAPGLSGMVAQQHVPPSCEVLPQGNAIARCYFSPKGNFLVTWEPPARVRVERPQTVQAPTPSSSSTAPAEGQPKGPGIALGKVENLVVWAIARRSKDCPRIFEVKINKDGKQRLGVNVDHLDGKSGLLIRRIDPGLVETYNREVHLQAGGHPVQDLVVAGDKIVAVNDVFLSAGAQAMAQEIQRADKLHLKIHRGSGWAFAYAAVKYFAPNMSPVRWPPILWSADESMVCRAVTNEILIAEGFTLEPRGRLPIDNILQMALSPGSQTQPSLCALAAFSPATSSASPGTIRVYTDFDKDAKPIMTKSFFSESVSVTMKFDPVSGLDLLVLFHASDLTEADVEGRTLNGQGGNGLYLLRASNRSQPICSLSNQEEGCVVEAQWCPRDRSGLRSLVMLQGPQPAMISVFTYNPSDSSAKSPPQRVNIGRVGVRNCLRWDPSGTSFSIASRSYRGGGISSEGAALDIFDAAQDGSVARRGGCTLTTKRDRQDVVGPCVSRIDFSPDGKVLMIAVEAPVGAEIRFASVADGSPLYRLKYEELYTSCWQPMPAGYFEVPQFDRPTSQARLGALLGSGILEVAIRDKNLVYERVKALRGGEGTRDILENNNAVIWEVTSAWGTHLLEGERTSNCKELARRFCRQNKMDMSFANPLAQRMEQSLFDEWENPVQSQPQVPQQGQKPIGQSKSKGVSQSAAAPPPRKPKPTPKVIDFADKDAVRRRVRALQKKIREIDKLKVMPEGSLEKLQLQKLASEGEVRAACASLERELDLLERVPAMVFKVDMPDGQRCIEFREGDNCYELAKQFIKANNLTKELINPLAAHMESKLIEEDILDPYT